MRNKNIFWTPIGLKSLKEAKVFILEHWDHKVLEHFLDLIDERINQLALNSKLAPIIDSTEYRKLVIHKNISIFYTVDSEIVKILLVWDNRQNPNVLKGKLINANKGV